MAFSMTWDFPPEVALPGRLPVAAQQVFVDFNKATNGVGTRANAYNRLPGLSLSDAAILLSGTHVLCKGTWRENANNFGRLLVAGGALAPLVYIGNDPTWTAGGDDPTATIDGSSPLASTPCASQVEARGCTLWQTMRKATLSRWNDPEDYRHCLYGGPNRTIRYLAGYPTIADNNRAFDYTLYAQYDDARTDKWQDIIWYPNINTAIGSAAYVAGQSRPRFNLTDLCAVMGLPVGTLHTAIDADCAPILQMVQRPQQWFTARMGRCNADGSPNPSGEYLTVIDGQTFAGASGQASSIYVDNISEHKIRLLNISRAIVAPGQYAMNPAQGWLVENPYGSEQLYRANGMAGLQFAANNQRLHGFKICGMSTSKSVDFPVGSASTGGNSLTIANGVNANSIVVQRNFFPGFGSIGGESRAQSYAECGHAQYYFNTMERQVIGSAIFASDGTGAKVMYNDCNWINGSNVRIIGGHTRNVRVAGNRIRNCNDLHGNGITMYMLKYNVIVEYNYMENVGRPITSSFPSNPAAPAPPWAYDSATYGAPSTIARNNTLKASGYGTVSAIRWQGTTEEGIITEKNDLAVIDPVAVKPALAGVIDPAKSGNWKNNRLVGVVPVPVGGDTTSQFLAKPGSTGNVALTYNSPEGLALLGTFLNNVDPAFAPQGVGHLAGGWDGNG